MENKQTAMSSLIEKILRMPESNIIGFLKIIGPVYIELEKEQIKEAYKSGCVGEMFELNINHSAEQYYEETYGTKKQDSEA